MSDSVAEKEDEEIIDEFIKLAGLDEEKSKQVTIFLLRSMSKRLARVEKQFLEYENNTNAYRVKRELKEENVTQKIDTALRNRLSLVYWFIDRAAPGLVVALILALLKFLHII